MNEMQVFQNSEFGELGVLEVNGKPYFPATACAKILGYAKPHNAIAQHCRYSLKQGVPHPQNPGKVVEMNFIPEGDLYRLITHSKLPAAERFEKWVFDEVLPTIRRTGGYSMPGAQTFTMEQMTQFAAEVASQVAMQIVPIIVATVKRVYQEAAQGTSPAPSKGSDFRPFRSGTANCLKLETFPEEIVDEVDRMLALMREQQALNFSQIARFCTMNGYTISSPSVKRYFDRHFSED
ncbi:BRO family protein [Oscillospiraceae bacterium 50-16]